jgi:hypothetical protein
MPGPATPAESLGVYDSLRIKMAISSSGWPSSILRIKDIEDREDQSCYTSAFFIDSSRFFRARVPRLAAVIERRRLLAELDV